MFLSLLIALQTASALPIHLMTASQPPVATTPDRVVQMPPEEPPVIGVRPEAITIAPPRPAAPTYRPPAPVEPFTLDVEVRAGQEMLWSGSLRAGEHRPAGFRRSITQAPALVCPNPGYGRPVDEETLRIGIVPQSSREGAQLATVTASWQRPVGRNCQERGSRSAELSQVIDLASGDWKSAIGDAGLVIRIRRR